MSTRTYSRSIVGLLIFVLAGCAQGVKGPKTVPVSGKVTYKDAPLANATVAFVQEAKAEEKMYTGTGQTDDQGNYKLSSFVTPSKPIDGAVPGKYMVTITKYSTPSGPTMADLMSGAKPGEDPLAGKSPEELAKMSSQGAIVNSTGEVQSGGTKSEIPERYGRPGESTLVAEVKDSGPQTFDFKLED
jgi:hypothetical protein